MIRFLEYVSPICLPTSTQTRTAAGDSVSVAGWGRTLTCKLCKI